MTGFLIVLHIIVCLALIAIVLLQGGKGAEIGASFGAGSSQTVFGATGGQSFLGKMTTAAAVIFMLTSLILAYFYGQPGSSSIMPGQVGTPAAQQAAPAPEQPAAAPASNAAPAPVPAAPESGKAK